MTCRAQYDPDPTRGRAAIGWPGRGRVVATPPAR
jgi:hypothetical protein